MAQRLTKMQRLTKLLEAEGFTEVTLHATTGWYRTAPQSDCVRWGGRAKKDGASLDFEGWDTMTLCVERGISVVKNNNTSWRTFMVHAREL